MAGFRSLAEQVRDPAGATERRRTALRKCLEKFAPYGHRATWHHLCHRAGFGTQERRPDPTRLVTALEELEEGRAVWLDYEREFAERRRQEKHEGIRRPTSLDDWHRQTWGGFGVAWCDDPALHPSASLATVLNRLIDALGTAPRESCPVCSDDRLLWRGGLAHCPSAGPVCLSCGIVVPEPVLTRETLAESKRWRRTLLASAG